MNWTNSGPIDTGINVIVSQTRHGHVAYKLPIPVEEVIALVTTYTNVGSSRSSIVEVSGPTVWLVTSTVNKAATCHAFVHLGLIGRDDLWVIFSMAPFRWPFNHVNCLQAGECQNLIQIRINVCWSLFLDKKNKLRCHPSQWLSLFILK